MQPYAAMLNRPSYGQQFKCSHKMTRQATPLLVGYSWITLASCESPQRMYACSCAYRSHVIRMAVDAFHAKMPVTPTSPLSEVLQEPSCEALPFPHSENVLHTGTKRASSRSSSQDNCLDTLSYVPTAVDFIASASGQGTYVCMYVRMCVHAHIAMYVRICVHTLNSLCEL